MEEKVKLKSTIFWNIMQRSSVVQTNALCDACFLLLSSMAYSSILKMEEVAPPKRR
jgi:hypothetical protein